MLEWGMHVSRKASSLFFSFYFYFYVYDIVMVVCNNVVCLWSIVSVVWSK
jgi:hypothetical protein